MKRLLVSLLLTMSLGFSCGLCGYTIKAPEPPVVVKKK